MNEGRTEDRPRPVQAARASAAELALIFIITAVVLIIDHYTKLLVEARIPLNTSIAPFPEYEAWLRLTHVTNRGAAFGLFPSGSTLFMVVAVIVSAVILIYNFRLPAGHGLMRVALGLQLAGALGNLIDRVRLGHVTDFIDIGPVPVFNVADASIVTGVILLGILMLFEPSPAGPAEAGEPAAGRPEPDGDDRPMLWNE
jgi:signal peptidase II